MKDFNKIVFTALLAGAGTALILNLVSPQAQINTSKLSEDIEQRILEKILLQVDQADESGKQEAKDQEPQVKEITKIISNEALITSVVEKAMPSVVSIVITKDLPKMEYYDPFEGFFNDGFFGGGFQMQRPTGETEERKIGGGTGFVVGDGLFLTNKHVVADAQANYTIVTQDNKKYDAQIWALDPVNDIAILKADVNLPALALGDSSKIKVGQSVIAIGNALGEFGNTVSTGIISGLQRSIGMQLRSLIQTDAAINQGNSGGPLLNLQGKVIGINVAKATNAENIGFAIPVNAAKKAIADVKEKGKIEYPFVGVKYNTNNHLILEVVPNSPADKAGIKVDDILLAINGHKLTKENNLAQILYFNPGYDVGDTIKVKILRQGEEKTLNLTLEKRN